MQRNPIHQFGCFVIHCDPGTGTGFKQEYWIEGPMEDGRNGWLASLKNEADALLVAEQWDLARSSDGVPKPNKPCVVRLAGDADKPVCAYLADGTKITIGRDETGQSAWLKIDKQATVRPRGNGKVTATTLVTAIRERDARIAQVEALPYCQCCGWGMPGPHSDQCAMFGWKPWDDTVIPGLLTAIRERDARIAQMEALPYCPCCGWGMPGPHSKQCAMFGWKPWDKAR